MLPFPFSKAAPKITLDSNRRLIALLGRLGEQLHDDCRKRVWNTLQLQAGWCRLSCDVAMHQFHRVGGREGKTPGHHLVECDAKSIEVAPRIDRTIHSPGLFGSHVRKCSNDELGRFGRLAFARKS